MKTIEGKVKISVDVDMVKLTCMNGNCNLRVPEACSCNLKHITIDENGMCSYFRNQTDKRLCGSTGYSGKQDQSGEIGETPGEGYSFNTGNPPICVPEHNYWVIDESNEYWVAERQSLRGLVWK